MYGKRRISISRNGEMAICGKYPGSRGGSHQRLGYINEAADGGFGVYFYNGKYIATVKTRAEAKVAIFNAASECSQHFNGWNDQIDAKGNLSKKTK